MDAASVAELIKNEHPQIMPLFWFILRGSASEIPESFLPERLPSRM